MSAADSVKLRGVRARETPISISNGVRLRRVQSRNTRWFSAAAITIAVLTLWGLCVAEMGRPPSLGLSAELRNGRLVVGWVQPGSAGWDAGIRAGDEILEVDGQAAGPETSAYGAAGASALVVKKPTGERVTASAETTPRVFRDLLLPFQLIAAAFFALGLSGFVFAKNQAPGRIFLGFGVSVGTLLLATLAEPYGSVWPFVLVYAAFAFFGTNILLIFLVFPANRLDTTMGRWSARLSIGTSAVMILCYGWIISFDPDAYPAFLQATFAVGAVEVLGAVALLGLSLVHIRSLSAQALQALSIAGLGTVGGLMPFVVLSMVPKAIGMHYLVRPEVSFLSMVLMPAGLASAVASRQFSSVRPILQRGSTAVVVWISLLASYVLVLETFYCKVADANGALQTLTGSAVPAIVLVGVTFHPAQEWIRKKFDHLLFPALFDLDREVESASRSIPQLREVEDIAGDVLKRLVRCLRVEWGAIRIDGGDHYPMVFTRREASAGAHGPLGGSPREPTSDGGPAASEPVSMQRPLVASGETIGTLVLGPKLKDLEVLPIDERLVSLLSPLTATALRNGLLIRRLNGQVRALAEREETLAALSLRLMHAQEEEAKKIALDIHDDPLQRAILLARRISEPPGDARSKEWAVEVDEVIISLRAICNSIRLPILDDFGLVKGLEWLVNNFRARSELEINFSREVSDEGILEQLHPDLQIAIYRIAQEALQNCLKHSNATRVEVILRATEEAAGLVITDNGNGYSRRADGERPSVGLGITGMRERLRPWGGSLYIESAEGGGTIVRVEVRRA